MSAVGNEIGELLIDLGYITSEQLSEALTEQEQSGDRITLVLSRLGLVSERQLKDALELQFGVNYINLSLNRPEPDTIKLIPEEVARKYRFVPVAVTGEQYSVAMVDPDDLIAADAVKESLGSEHFKKLVCTADDFDYLLYQTYENAVTESDAEEDTGEVEENGFDPDPATEAVTERPSKKISSLFDADDEDDLDFASDRAETAQPEDEAPQVSTSLFGDDDDDDDFETDDGNTVVSVSGKIDTSAIASEVDSIISSLEREAASVEEVVQEPVHDSVPQKSSSLSLFGEEEGEDEDEDDSSLGGEEVASSPGSLFGDDDDDDDDDFETAENEAEARIDGASIADEVDSIFDSFEGKDEETAEQIQHSEETEQEAVPSALAAGSLFGDDEDDDDDFEKEESAVIDGASMDEEVDSIFDSFENEATPL
ncbi:MAG: hypothetical protein R3D26_12655 [Cyanobacteriota/Melainabacteria group bacterium]